MPQRMTDKPQTHPSANIGKHSLADDPNHRTAADYKDLVRMFRERFTINELRAMPIVPAGTPLKDQAVYIDLAARDSGPVTAHDGVAARADQFLVPKNEVPYDLWNRLLD